MSDSVTTTGISPYLSGYVGEMLGKGQALANTSYLPYGGERLAGFQPLQNRAFEGIASLADYTPMDYSDPSKFMSPYQQNVTDIALREARRQSDISGQANAARAVQQGAFGGSRHGLVEAERERNLQQQLGDIQAKGLQSAFTSAQQGQYLQDLANRAGQTLGIDRARALFGLGTKQQEQEQKGLDLDYGTFSEAREFPYKQLRFQRELLSGVPMTSTSVTGPGTDWASTALGIAGLLGRNPDAVKNVFGNLGNLFGVSGDTPNPSDYGNFTPAMYGNML